MAAPIKPYRPGRLPAPDYLLSLHQWGDRLLTDKRVARLLSKPGVVTELVVHPGYVDDDALPPGDQLQPLQRQVEVDLLTGVAFRHWLSSWGCSWSAFRISASSWGLFDKGLRFGIIVFVAANGTA